jgi:predicted MFS family arabinose efflux permease
VVSALMVVATAGTLLFATGRGFAALAIGRGLAGLGVSACLMGGLKIFGDAFPAERHASLTGLIMAAGTAGALVASAPLAWALPVLGWRGSLLLVTGLCALAALLVHLVVPAAVAEHSAEHAAESPLAQGQALLSVLRSRPFWRYAPQTAFFTGGFMALQGLWFVTWLMTVDGRSRGQAAGLLFLLNLGLLLGQAAISAGATRLHAAGISRGRLMTGGLALALVSEGLLVARLANGPAIWLALGICYAAGAQVYGVASSQFPARLAGRVSTALNLLAFAGAFLIQWGIGVALQALGGAPRTLQLIFAGLWLLQAGAVAWSIRLRAPRPRPAPPPP